MQTLKTGMMVEYRMNTLYWNDRRSSGEPVIQEVWAAAEFVGHSRSGAYVIKNERETFVVLPENIRVPKEAISTD